jgi:hypothetical protein
MNRKKIPRLGEVEDASRDAFSSSWEKFADGPKFGWQATKGTRWMPRRAEARKDVVSCDKRRGGAHIPRSVDVRMGEPRTVNLCDPCGEHIAARKPTWGSEPSQYPEEQKATAIPRVAASETGRA